MADIVYIGTKIVDSGFNEEAWSDPQSWVFAAKAVPKVSAHTPSQGSNVALYKIGCSCSVIHARTFYQPGSTVFPDNYPRRVWVKVEIFVQLLAGSYSTIDLTEFDVQLIRIS